MDRNTKILILIGSVAALGGATYFIANAIARKPIPVPPSTTTTTEQDVHGGVISALSGILNGLHISLA